MLPTIDPDTFATFILICGFMVLLMKLIDPTWAACPDCGSPGSHWPDCKRVNKNKKN